MSDGENPRAALAAILAAPIAVKGIGEEVRPFSLAMFAALDRLRSPLLYGDAERTDALSLIPSLFTICKGWKEATRPDLFDRAMEWADALPPDALPRIRDAAIAQIQTMLDIVPESKKKLDTRETDGL